MVDENFVLEKAQSLLSQFAKAKGSLGPPVELRDLARFCSVLSIEHRPMVPEGVLSTVPGGFKVYLQSNFTHKAGMERRTRFTLAHELAHTFFYNTAGQIPQIIKGSPKGRKLEYLCHVAANEMLVPSSLLKREVEARGEVASADSIIDLATLFEVSTEVMMRKLQKLGLFADDRFAAILVHVENGSKSLIKAACYGSLLLCNAPRPERGMDFDLWVRPIRPPDGEDGKSEWVCTTQTSTVIAKKIFRSRRSFILDLSFRRPDTHKWKPGQPDSSTR
jgi:uncharacterized protein DUF955